MARRSAPALLLTTHTLYLRATQCLTMVLDRACLSDISGACAAARAHSAARMLKCMTDWAGVLYWHSLWPPFKPLEGRSGSYTAA